MLLTLVCQVPFTMAAIRNKVLVLNAGSSSLKFKLFEMGEPLAVLLVW